MCTMRSQTPIQTHQSDAQEIREEEEKNNKINENKVARVRIKQKTK